MLQPSNHSALKWRNGAKNPRKTELMNFEVTELCLSQALKLATLTLVLRYLLIQYLPTLALHMLTLVC